MIPSLVQEHAEVEGSVGIASLLGALVRSNRSLEVSSLVEEDAEVEGSCRGAALIGAPVNELLELGQFPGVGLTVARGHAAGVTVSKELEVRARAQMPALGASLPGGPGAIEVAGLVQQDPEVEPSVLVTSLLGVPIGRHRSSEVTLLMQEDPSVERIFGVAFVSATGGRRSSRTLHI
jgi:hypothetical protein